jgi:hypothetical protein
VIFLEYVSGDGELSAQRGLGVERALRAAGGPSEAARESAVLRFPGSRVIVI